MKTIKVLIAVAIGRDGQYNAAGHNRPQEDDDPSITALAKDGLTYDAQVHYVTADIPLPQSITVPGTVEGEA